MRLSDGRADQPMPVGTANRLRTWIVGEPAYGDLDGDGDEDALVWLARQSGGSGSFFYLAAAVGEHREFRGTNAAFVGDRIAPGALKVENGIAVAEFRDRGPGAAMASEPTIARVARYRLFSGVLQVAAQ